MSMHHRRLTVSGHNKLIFIMTWQAFCHCHCFKQKNRIGQHNRCSTLSIQTLLSYVSRPLRCIFLGEKTYSY